MHRLARFWAWTFLGAVACGSPPGVVTERDAGATEGGTATADAAQPLDADRPGDGGSESDAAVTECTGLASLRSVGRLTLVAGPFECGSPDASEVLCGVFEARVEEARDTAGPEDDPALDEGLPAVNVLLSVRAPSVESLCRGSSPWVVFESGGPGRGYGPTFGDTEPGHYIAGGSGWGDDLIRWYNDRGYVTVDVHWTCATAECERSHAGWVTRPGRVSGGAYGWFALTEGLGYVATGSRALPIYEWAHAHAGRRVCAHAHSGGSGRAITVLTRYAGDDHLAAVVFDGGPVFAYAPWYCDIDEGPLGPQTDRFALRACDRDGDDADPTNDDCAASNAAIYDCARTAGDNTASCRYSMCRRGILDLPAMLEDSSFLRAARRDFATMGLGVVLGGADHSPAPAHARLWLSGYDFGSRHLAGLSAAEIVVRQGFCAGFDGTYAASGGVRPCSDWDMDGFEGVAASGVGFDGRLTEAGHDTTRTEGGARTAHEVMLSLCPP